MTDNALRWDKALQAGDLPLSTHRYEREHFDLITNSKHINTIGDLMMQTLANWGIKQVFGTTGQSNSGHRRQFSRLSL